MASLIQHSSLIYARIACNFFKVECVLIIEREPRLALFLPFEMVGRNWGRIAYQR
jgi:hypothetical protein